MRYILLTAIMAANSAWAQTSALKGNYFFEESGLTQLGQTFHSVATLAFDGQGQLQGTHYVKGIGTLAQSNVRGNYSIEGNGGALTIERAVADPDTESGVRIESATYRILKTSAGAFEALRTDAGALAEASLTPLAAGVAPRGDFTVTERGVNVLNQSYVTLGSWSFDGNGNVSANLASRTFGVVAASVFTGRLSPLADGTFDLLLTGPASEDPEAIAPVMTYKVIPNGRGFELLRVDSGIVAETSVSAR